MHLRTMGGVTLSAADGTPLLTGRRKELLLLAYLARRAPRSVPRAELAALFWDDRPADRARLSLRQALFRIRQLLPDGLVVTREEVGLRAGAVEVDVNRIERAAAAGAHETVAGEWRGEFLPEADDAAGATWRLWLEGERAAHRRLITRSLQALVAEASARAAWPEAIAHATAWCDAMPDDVQAHRRLTDVLVLADRGVEALARHASFMARQRFEGEPASAELDALEVRLNRSAGPTSSHLGAGGIFSPDMVGRGDEFAELSNAWRDARAGHPAVVVIEGDAGMGKTRLVSEFIRTIALGRGTSVRLHARAYGHDSGGDYGLARELLAPLASARGLAAAAPQELATLSLLLPSLRTRFAELPEPSIDERALSMAVARVLTDVAEEQTVLLVVDDLAAADAASVRLLLGALRRLGESAGAAESAPRLLAILTVRTDALSRAELRDAPSVRWLQLRPLDALQTESLIASMLELPPAERLILASRLSAASGG